MKGSFYPILNVGLAWDLKTLLDRLAMWRSYGLSYYQLRAKYMRTQEAYMVLASKLRHHYPDLSLIANDYIDLALAQAQVFSGLHLGQEDIALLTKAQYNQLEQCSQKNSFVCGISTHNAMQMKEACSKSSSIIWDYIALGACFPTHSKIKKEEEGYAPPLLEQNLIDGIREAYKSMREKQALVLIGGIKSSNIKQLVKLVRAEETREKQFSFCIAAIEAACSTNEIEYILKILKNE